MRPAGLMTLLLIVSNAFSQVHTTSDSLSTVSPDGSISVVKRVPAETSRVDTGSAGYVPTKLPGVALALSAVLPGAGQFYNESYWKIPILLGFGYYFAREWIDNNDSTRHYRDLYAASITQQNPGGNANFQSLREFYKDQRDTFSWYIFLYYIVNLVDAYVDASLYDFNVGDDLSIRVQPSFQQNPHHMSINVKVHF